MNLSFKQKLCLKALCLGFFDANGILISIISAVVALLTINLELYGRMHYEKDEAKVIDASKHLQRIGFLIKKIMKSLNSYKKTRKKFFGHSQLGNVCFMLLVSYRNGS